MAPNSVRALMELVAAGADAFALADVFGFGLVPTIRDGAEVVGDDIHYDARQSFECQQQLIESALLRALAAEERDKRRTGARLASSRPPPHLRLLRYRS